MPPAVSRGVGHLRPRGDGSERPARQRRDGTGFSGTGINAFNAEDYTVAHVRARNNEGYGIAGFVLSGVRFLHSVATDNGEPGIYIGDSHDAQAVVIGNTSIHNGVGGEGFGFLFRDSSNGRVSGFTSSTPASMRRSR